MRGQSELGLDIAMASVAQFRLRLDQLAVVQPAGLFRQLGYIEEVALRCAQTFGLGIPSSFDKVYRVATVAGNAMLDMGRVREILLIAVTLMAHQAAFGILSWVRFERKDQLAGRGGFGVVALRGFLPIGVRLAGAVAHFAASYGIGLRGLEGGMAREIELLGFCFVTRPAALRSQIGSAGDWRHGRYAY